MEPSPPPEVFSSLPRSRPHRRSDKRPRQPAQPPREQAQHEQPPHEQAQPAPAETPQPAPQPPQPSGGGRIDVLGTAVQAAAELAEIGLSVGARALSRVVSRLPRP